MAATAPTDGSGVWDTSALWYTSAGTNDVAWTNSVGDTAQFGSGSGDSTPYTVTLAQPVTAKALTFQDQAYTLTGSTLDLAGSSPTIAVNASAGTISSTLIANGGLTKNGSGALTLNGAGNSIGGGWFLLNQGTLAVTGGNINVSSLFMLGAAGTGVNQCTYTQSDGAVNMNGNAVYVGDGAGLSTFNLSGGSFSGAGVMYFAYVNNAVTNVSGSGSLSVGSFQSGTDGPTTGTINVAPGGSFTFGGGGNAYLSMSGGARGVMNISGGSVTLAGNSLVFNGDNDSGDNSGAVNQSGGLFNLAGGGAVLGAAAGSGYGGYTLSSGTLNVTGTEFSIADQSQSLGLFSQTGGNATFANNFYLGRATSGLGTAVADISGGTLTHAAAGNFMSTGGGTAILTIRGSGYVQEQTGNFYVTHASGATGIVNLLSGGTLEVNSIQNAGGHATINFDGGTLRAYATNAGANFLTGLTNAFIYPGGLTVDTAGQTVSIGQRWQRRRAMAWGFPAPRWASPAAAAATSPRPWSPSRLPPAAAWRRPA